MMSSPRWSTIDIFRCGDGFTAGTESVRTLRRLRSSPRCPSRPAALTSVSMSPLAFVLMCQYSGNFFVQLIYYILAEYVLEKFDRPPPEQELFLD